MADNPNVGKTLFLNLSIRSFEKVRDDNEAHINPVISLGILDHMAKFRNDSPSVVFSNGVGVEFEADSKVPYCACESACHSFGVDPTAGEDAEIDGIFGGVKRVSEELEA